MGKKASGDLRKEWIERIDRFKASGLTQQKFCEQEEIKMGNFYYWNKKLGNVTPQSKNRSSSSKSNSQGASPGNSVSSQPLEISLPNGAIVRLPFTASEAEIAKVLRAASTIAQEE